MGSPRIVYLPWFRTLSSSSACHIPTAWDRVRTQALCSTNQSTSSVPTQHCLQHTNFLFSSSAWGLILSKRGWNASQAYPYLYVLRWYFLSRIMCVALDRMALRRTFPALCSFSEGICRTHRSPEHLSEWIASGSPRVNSCKISVELRLQR